jgi:hypothetical protein
MLRTLLALWLGLGAAPLAAQAPEIRPGLWAFTITGARTGGKGLTQQICFTPQMVKDMKGVAAKGDPTGDCKTSNEKVAGKSRSFDVACTKPSAYRARVTITVDGPDSFTMAQDYTIEEGGTKQQGNVSFSYRRVGECPK